MILFYGDVKEEVPANSPKELGKGVDITNYVVTYHEGDQITCWSHTKIFIFFNSVPIF